MGCIPTLGKKIVLYREECSAAPIRCFTHSAHGYPRSRSAPPMLQPTATERRVAPLGAPMLAREVRMLPMGEDWIYEFLWGGERVRAIKYDTVVNLISREGRDLTNRFPRIAATVARLRAQRVVLDGEILYLESYPLPVVRFLAESRRKGKCERRSGPRIQRGTNEARVRPSRSNAGAFAVNGSADRTPRSRSGAHLARGPSGPDACTSAEA